MSDTPGFFAQGVEDLIHDVGYAAGTLYDGFSGSDTTVAPMQSGGASSSVKGVPAQDGGVPQTPGFFASLGEGIVNLTKPHTTGESIESTAKWVALGVAAVAAVLIVTKLEL